MTKAALKPGFDFISTNELPYERRDAFGSGDYYGIGDGPKHGKARSSFIGVKPPSKEEMRPPVKIK